MASARPRDAWTSNGRLALDCITADSRVGRIPAEAGAEPLLGTHLRASLATVLSDRLLRVLAIPGGDGFVVASGVAAAHRVRHVLAYR